MYFDIHILVFISFFSCFTAVLFKKTYFTITALKIYFIVFLLSHFSIWLYINSSVIFQR